MHTEKHISKRSIFEYTSNFGNMEWYLRFSFVLKNWFSILLSFDFILSTLLHLFPLLSYSLRFRWFESHTELPELCEIYWRTSKVYGGWKLQVILFLIDNVKMLGCLLGCLDPCWNFPQNKIRIRISQTYIYSVLSYPETSHLLRLLISVNWASNFKLIITISHRRLSCLIEPNETQLREQNGKNNKRETVSGNFPTNHWCLYKSNMIMSAKRVYYLGKSLLDLLSQSRFPFGVFLLADEKTKAKKLAGRNLSPRA